MAPTFTVGPAQAGGTLAAVLRHHLSDHSWSQVRALVASRRVQVGGSLCQDPARRLKEGEVIALLTRPLVEPAGAAITIRYRDAHLLVVEKPTGLRTVPHPSERGWSRRRKALNPALVDLVQTRLARNAARPAHGQPRLRVVHRLDKDTSGLLVFARTVAAEQGLGKQFKAHTVVRRYLAIAPGHVRTQRIVSRLVRDRGDGRRGSTTLPGVGKEAITYVETLEHLKKHTLLSCRLETGRTHQIRIHLAEAGHPVCGETVYVRRPDGTPLPQCPGAPRLALHAAELGFEHPITGEPMHWSMTLPEDLRRYLDALRGRPPAGGRHANQVDRHRP